MQHDFKFNEENIIAASDVIFHAGVEVTCIALLVSGKIEKTFTSASGVSYRRAYDAGSFIAYNDLYCGLYSGNYKASSECVIIPFECKTPAEWINSLKTSFRGFVESRRPAFYNYLRQLILFYNTTYRDVSAFYADIVAAKAKFEDILKSNSVTAPVSAAITSPDSLKLTNLSFYQTYKNFGNTPLSFDNIMEIITDFYGYYDDIFSYLNTLVQFASGHDEACLPRAVAKSSETLPKEIRGDLCAIIDDINRAALALEKNMYGYVSRNVNFDYYSLRACKTHINEGPKEHDTAPHEAAPRERHENLTGVFKKLLTYASYSKEESLSIYNALEAFKKLPDKGATDDSARKLRKLLADEYYNLYERVFLTYAASVRSGSGHPDSDSLYIDLFLNYGLLDETVTNNEWVSGVSSKAPSPCGSPCTVYHMKDWLMSIYDGVNMPSKNEYDEEYLDYVRKKKKELNLTPEKERELLEDGVLKVKYEIHNMFKCNNRLLNGNLACFYPMLNDYSNEQPLTKLALTADIINEEFNDLTAIDFSAFYRESMYENLALGISKENVMREVYPFVILFPIYGVNCVMWQEISGKRINNPGRFFMPAFFGGDFSLAIMRMVARFRWELCKTYQGLAWNDVTVPSLTSEYNDYLQFYRKNKELSPEKKEQVKNQLSRCRNNIRETFIQDYCSWLKFESMGAMRLNKIARRIFASYCPFPKAMRDNLEQQPLFAEAMVKFNRERQKKAKEISMHYSALSRKGIELTKELTDTLDFYTKY